MILQFQKGCIPFEYKQYSVWDDVLLIFMLLAYFVLYVGCAYYFMLGLKIVINKMKNHFKKEKC